MANLFIRLLDILLATLALLLTLPLLVLLYVFGLMDTGSPILRQTRLGQDLRPFTLYKFRTMRLGTPTVATHLVHENAVTRYGRWLRATKLDELPQLLNVLTGSMSLVGPRPCLPNQDELIAARRRLGVFSLKPGLTGPAQVLGVDMSQPQRLAELDALWLHERSVTNYLYYIMLTMIGRGFGDRIRASRE
ncbi:MAG: sugar transferase [Thiobacillaceae bacterium]|nr:sugar transferase [Thiobacillaceae bacterium]MDW8324044.1 sugar transferase [Burkholderiales bacterium]